VNALLDAAQAQATHTPTLAVEYNSGDHVHLGREAKLSTLTPLPPGLEVIVGDHSSVSELLVPSVMHECRISIGKQCWIHNMRIRCAVNMPSGIEISIGDNCRLYDVSISIFAHQVSLTIGRDFRDSHGDFSLYNSLRVGNRVFCDGVSIQTPYDIKRRIPRCIGDDTVIGRSGCLSTELSQLSGITTLRLCGDVGKRNIILADSASLYKTGDDVTAVFKGKTCAMKHILYDGATLISTRELGFQSGVDTSITVGRNAICTIRSQFYDENIVVHPSAVVML